MAKLQMKTTFLLCAAMALFFMLPAIYIISYTVDRSIAQATASVKTEAEALALNIEERISSQLTLMNRMTQSLYGNMLDIIQDPEYAYQEYEDVKRRALLEDYLYSLAGMSDYITGIYIITATNNLYYSSSYAIAPDHQQTQSRLLEEYSSGSDDHWYVTPHTPWLAYRGSDETVISICRQLSDLQGELLGVAIVDISTEQYDAILAGAGGTVSFDTFLLGQDDEVIACRQNGPSYSAAELLSVAGHGEEAVTLGGRSAFVNVTELPEAGWRLVSVVFEDSLRQAAAPLIRLRTLSIAAIGLAGALLLLLVFIRIYRPLKKLVSAMTRAEGGDLSACVAWNTRDEYGYLIRSYNRMLHTINELIDQKYAAELKQLDAEFNDLKGRINPHFILNTMQVISSSAVLNDDLETEELIQLFCGMLRYTLYEPQRIVPLRKEMEHVDRYLQLRRRGLGWKVDVHWDVSPELQDHPVMKLTLQPLVENCFQHAFCGRAGEEIRIQAWRQNDALHIEVADNGRGIGPVRLEELRDRLKGGRGGDAGLPASRGIALHNIASRLEILYGEKGRLRIESEEGSGTRVTVEMPDGANHENL